MNTTDNTNVQPENDDQAEQMRVHSETGNDPNKTEDEQRPEDLVQAEVSAPISESQVQPGREAVDGNGRRDLEEREIARPDIVVNPDADTQAKAERQQAAQEQEAEQEKDTAQIQQEQAQTVQDKETAKLDSTSKPGRSGSRKNK